MSKEAKKVVIIKIIQIFIFCISIITAFLYRGISPNWPFYLLLLGILVGLLIPVKYRLGFSSKEPGFLFKRYTRGTENLIELIVTLILIVVVLVLTMV